MRRVLATLAAAALTAAGLALTATAANAAPTAEPMVYDCSTYSPVVNGEIENFTNALGVQLPADPGGVAINCTPLSAIVPGSITFAVNQPVQCAGALGEGLVLTGCTPYQGS